MNRTITVRGTGHSAAAPDTIEIPITLDTLKKEYDEAVEESGLRLAAVRKTLGALGFEEKELKTSRLDTSPYYENERNRSGDYCRVLRGYRCELSLRLRFPMDPKRLSEVIAALGACKAKPEFSVSFTVRDSARITESLLRGAAENARAKAEILCAASGVRLGTLQSIDYSWGELRLYSDTEIGCGRNSESMMKCCAADMELEPEEIENSESATFIWEIE